MKIIKTIAAAGLLLSTVTIAASAQAQDYRDGQRYDHARDDRGDHRYDRRDDRRHYGWDRHNRRCWTEWRHHRQVRICR